MKSETSKLKGVASVEKDGYFGSNLLVDDTDEIADLRAFSRSGLPVQSDSRKEGCMASLDP